MDYAAEPLSEDALLLRFGDAIDAATNARVHAAATQLRAANLAAVIDLAPAYASLLLRFDPFVRIDPHDPETAPHARLLAAIDSILRDAQSPPPALPTSRIVEIPVRYGGACGPDLGEAARHARLGAEEFIARHAAAEYHVAMLGFAPGFPYLLGLDPALHTPRRETPRTRVPAGSVAIGGAQTGIYPRELPGGWQVIGRTPMVLFDAAREPPCLLAPGDRVRFRAIDETEFAALREDGAENRDPHPTAPRAAVDLRDRGRSREST
ncbi:MAG: 5-oxoprolinase subunit PxpB [Proteobacteria bacterium]|nr:5-oxoprolinase subunit PxpB [Pseudomonadota bacterium]